MCIKPIRSMPCECTMSCVFEIKKEKYKIFQFFHGKLPKQYSTKLVCVKYKVILDQRISLQVAVQRFVNCVCGSQILICGIFYFSSHLPSQDTIKAEIDLYWKPYFRIMPYLVGILLADIMFRFKSNEANKVFKRVRNPLSLWNLMC